MRFFLGTHRPAWLADRRFADVPLFVSRRTFPKRKLPRAVTDWALDSGGFTELNLHGRWETTPQQYIADVRRFRDEIGRLAWAAPQDWMCEPFVVAKTGLSVSEHQVRTIRNFQELRALAPDLPIVPVLQGWSLGDYWRCVDLYEMAGVRLDEEPLVGVGSVCRRQHTSQAETIMRTLAGTGGYRLKLHGFGFKTKGLIACTDTIASADSLAWSYQARRRNPLPGHDKPGPHGHGHINCANCADYALMWRTQVLDSLSAREAA